MTNYAFTFHNGRTITADGTGIGTSAALHNLTVEANELALWSSRPDRALAYFSFPADLAATRGTASRDSYRPMLALATVKTWMGTVLGTITSARVYRHNLGGRFVSLKVSGSNGASYSGRASWDNGNCIILRKVR